MYQKCKMARIPIRQEYHIVKKIKDLHAKWQGLKKNAKRQSDNQKEYQDQFVDILDDLFVAHDDALSLIKIAEDRAFLEAQREKGRRGSLGPVDTKLAKLENRRRQPLDRNHL